MVYQLIYTSRAQSGIDTRTLEQIAYLSSGRNEVRDVTGILINAGDLILQVLEGEEFVVRDIFNTLCRDTRHYEVTVLCEGENTQREFPGVFMRFKSITCKTKRGLLNALTDDSPLMDISGGQRIFA